MNSNQWFEKAKMYIPGGVNSPVRAFRDVGGTPIYFKTALGSLIQTEDNIELIDFCNCFSGIDATNEILYTISFKLDLR